MFYKFIENIKKIYGPKNILWHLLAFLLTYILVVTNFDWKYFTFFNGSAPQKILFPIAAAFGGLVPIFLPIVLYVLGKLKRNLTLENIAYAVAQSAILGWLVSSFYKMFTGRIEPPLRVEDIVDISRSFQFGFWEHGIFWGWPSSHTTVAFAVATALIVLYPKNLAVRIISIIFAFSVGIGASMSFHWFSDFVAGAIIGTVIGVVVGKAFVSRLSTLPK